MHFHRRQADLWTIVAGRAVAATPDLHDALTGRAPCAAWESYLDVPGLGLAAWWEPTLGELAVLAGQQTLTVIVVSDSVDPKTAALQIADLALPRLR